MKIKPEKVTIKQIPLYDDTVVRRKTNDKRCYQRVFVLEANNILFLRNAHGFDAGDNINRRKPINS